MEIWDSVLRCIEKGLSQARSDHPELKVTALGITNQRETTMAWDSRTGVLLTAWGRRCPSVCQLELPRSSDICIGVLSQTHTHTHAQRVQAREH